VNFTHGNGLKSEFISDPRTGRLKQLIVAPAVRPGQSSTPLYFQSNRTDAAGRITEIQQTGTAYERPAIEKYQYDGHDRLIAATVDAKLTRWTYDRVGNRLSMVQNNPPEKVQDLSYKERSNQLTSYQGSDGEKNYQYDLAGNPLRIGQTRYFYNPTGRLREVKLHDGTSINYSYNINGERISKTMLEKDKRVRINYFLYSGANLETEADADGHVSAHYIYIGHTPIAKLEYPSAKNLANTQTPSFFEKITRLVKAPIAPETRIFAIHSNHLGTPQIVTNSSQNIVWRAGYSAFGQANVDIQKITLNLRFPGQYFDKETGTHYNYFRDYDPGTGRYIQSDPIGLEGGVNTYAYVNGQPTRYTDPLGLQAIPIPAPVPLPGGVTTPGGKSSGYDPAKDIFIPPSVPGGSSPLAILCKVAPLACAVVIANEANQENGKTCPDLPTIDWNDPSKPPVGLDGKPWTWRGPDAPGGNRGGYVNPNNPDQSMHPDLNHPDPVGPHWDFTDRNVGGWRVFPGGAIKPK
jgi:RHS repeat-associated protein